MTWTCAASGTPIKTGTGWEQSVAFTNDQDATTNFTQYVQYTDPAQIPTVCNAIVAQLVAPPNPPLSIGDAIDVSAAQTPIVASPAQTVLSLQARQAAQAAATARTAFFTQLSIVQQMLAQQAAGASVDAGALKSAQAALALLPWDASYAGVG